MTRPRIVAVGISLLLLLTAVAAPRARALQRGIYTSVLDKDGKPVAGLTAADFVVREDNLAREVLRVEPATTPMQIALLVDNSARSNNNIRDIREAAGEFVKAVTGTGMKNEVAVITVAERATILVDYTSDQAKLLKGAIFTQPGSGAYKLTRSPPPTAAPVRMNSRRLTTAGALISPSVHLPARQLCESLCESSGRFHTCRYFHPLPRRCPCR